MQQLAWGNNTMTNTKTTVTWLAHVTTTSTDHDALHAAAQTLFARPSRSATAYALLVGGHATNGVTLYALTDAYNATGGKGTAGPADNSYVASWYVPSWIGRKLPGLAIDRKDAPKKGATRYRTSADAKLRGMARKYLAMAHGGARSARAIAILAVDTTADVS